MMNMNLGFYSNTKMKEIRTFAPFCTYLCDLWVINEISLVGWIWTRADLFNLCIFWIYAPYVTCLLNFWMSVRRYDLFYLWILFKYKHIHTEHRIWQPRKRVCVTCASNTRTNLIDFWASCMDVWASVFTMWCALCMCTVKNEILQSSVRKWHVP